MIKYDQQLKLEESFKDLVKQVKETELLGDEIYEEYTSLKKQLIEGHSIQNENDKNLYRRYIERIKNENYFDLRHIYDLGIDFDILIFLGKKGCGKSYWLNKKMNEIADANGEIFFMRMTDSDVASGAKYWMEDYNSNLKITGNTSTGFKIVHKTKTQPNSTKALVCGYASGIKTAPKWKGGSFSKVKLIAIDEITDDRKGVYDVHDVQMLFTHVLNSIERTKEVPLICFGNADQTVGKVNPFLAAFDIPEHINFKYAEKQFPGSTKPTKFLYINSRGLFAAGIHTSKLALSISDVTKVKGLLENKKIDTCSKLCNLDYSVACDPVYCLIFFFQQEIVCFTLSKTQVDNEDWFFVKFDKFTPEYSAIFGENKFTDNEAIYNQYGGIVKLLSNQEMFYIWRDILEIFESNRAIIKSGSELNSLVPRIVDMMKQKYDSKLHPKRRQSRSMS